MKKALIIVDVQNDFMPWGALPVADGDKIIPVINALMPKFDVVVATRDFHPHNHCSFASNHPTGEIGDEVEIKGMNQTLWPNHCVAGKDGSDFSVELDTQNIDAVFDKGTDPGIDSYSGFFDNQHNKKTGLADYLTEHDVNTVFITGLATDYCVKFTALDAVSIGFETWLVTDACRGVDLNQGDVNKAIAEMEAANINITTKDELR